MIHADGFYTNIHFYPQSRWQYGVRNFLNLFPTWMYNICTERTGYFGTLIATIYEAMYHFVLGKYFKYLLIIYFLGTVIISTFLIS